MIVRDGRRVEHDLGPRRWQGNITSSIDRRFFRPMPEGASWRDETTRRWLKAKRTPEQVVAAKRAKDNAHRAANIEHYRRLERERCRRYRARKRAQAV